MIVPTNAASFSQGLPLPKTQEILSETALEALAPEPAGGRYRPILKTSPQFELLQEQGRDSRAIHGFHFKGAPLSVLVQDDAGTIRLSTFEYLLESAALQLEKETGLTLRASLGGSSRYMRSGQRPNLIIMLETPLKTPREKQRS
jgi:hypothetical protein